mmetsp:Transcript_63151/g.124872  ORF Transcript_63151/g.124872 Transcript_63151/m.124872 type:complete len:378 (-) Transcript_63151:212-1345(-)
MKLTPAPAWEGMGSGDGTSSAQSATKAGSARCSPLTPRDSSELILHQEDLCASVRSLWSTRKRMGCFYMFNSTKYKLRFLLRLGEVSLNVSYVLYALASATIEGGPIFRSLKRAVLWVEVIVVMGCVVTEGTMFLLLLCGIKRPHPAFVLRAWVETLELAGNFSMLSYLPLPPKLTYWWNHHEVFLHKLLHPSILAGRSIYKAETWRNMLQSENNSSRAQILRAVRGVLVVPLLLITQVLVPLCMLAFPLLAPGAFLVKMEGLPDVRYINDWDRSAWLSFLGVLNQASDMWDVDMVEQRAMLSLVFVVDTEKQSSAGAVYEQKLDEFKQELAKAILHELGLIRAGVLLAAQDCFVLAFLLHRFLPLRHRAVRWDVTD